MSKKFKMLLILSSLCLSSIAYSENVEIKQDEKIAVQESVTTQAVTVENGDVKSEKAELSLNSDVKNKNSFLLQLKSVYGFDEKYHQPLPWKIGQF